MQRLLEGTEWGAAAAGTNTEEMRARLCVLASQRHKMTERETIILNIKAMAAGQGKVLTDEDISKIFSIAEKVSLAGFYCRPDSLLATVLKFGTVAEQSNEREFEPAAQN